MLALHAIFVMVTKYGLEYPQFYARLYQLLHPSSLMVRPNMYSLSISAVLNNRNHVAMLPHRQSTPL